MEHLINIPQLQSSVTLNYIKAKKGWSFPIHRHHFFEFFYCVSGALEEIVNGQPYLLKPGDAMIIKYGILHQTNTLQEDAEFFVFHFDIEDKNVLSIFQMAQNPVIYADSTNEDGFSVSHWVNSFIEEFQSFLTQEHGTPPTGIKEKLALSITTLRVQIQCLDFICRLGEHFLREQELFANHSVTPTQVQLAHKIAYLLELHSSEPLKINQVAQELGFHRSYLNDSFKRVYGISPKEYSMQMNIRLAKQLLQNSDHSVEKIAELLGFSSQPHFSKFFSKAVGSSPLKFRNQLRSGLS